MFITLFLSLDFNDLTPEAMATIESVARLNYRANSEAIGCIHAASIANCGKIEYGAILREVAGVFATNREGE